MMPFASRQCIRYPIELVKRISCTHLAKEVGSLRFPLVGELWCPPFVFVEVQSGGRGTVNCPSSGENVRHPRAGAGESRRKRPRIAASTPEEPPPVAIAQPKGGFVLLDGERVRKTDLREPEQWRRALNLPGEAPPVGQHEADQGERVPSCRPSVPRAWRF